MLLRVIEDELETCSVRDHLADGEAVLEGGEHLQLALVLPVEEGHLVVGGTQVQPALLKVKLHSNRKGLVLGSHVESRFTRRRKGNHTHLDC